MVGNMTKKELEEKIKEYQILLLKNDNIINELLSNADNAFKNSPYCHQMERDVEILKESLRNAENRLRTSQEREEKLRDRIEMLERSASIQPHNARNAGRRKNDSKWQESYSQWCQLYQSQKSINEIIETMGISRATYFRYKKHYQNNDLSEL